MLNGANPRRPNIAPYRVNDMEVFFRDIELLAAFYGVDVFMKKSVSPGSRHLFYVRSLGRPAEGRGYYDEDSGRFILQKGSMLAEKVVASYKNANRDKFIAEKCRKINGEIILQDDTAFDSPSGASGMVLGRPSNGWYDWTDDKGNRLGTVYPH